MHKPQSYMITKTIPILDFFKTKSYPTTVIPKRTKPNFMPPKYICKRDKDQKNTCQNLWVADMKKNIVLILYFILLLLCSS